MDVKMWRVSIKKHANTRNGGVGVALTVELKCRICRASTSTWAAVELYPENLRPESRVRVGSPRAQEPWNQFVVKRRLADSRACSECGTQSIIPPKQQEALIIATSDEVQLDWLQEVVEEMGLQVDHKLISGGRDPKYEAFFYVPDDAPTEFALYWHPFSMTRT